jgi:mannose-1-phosphate guanylyltransferase
VIGARSTIEAGAQVIGSVVADGVHVSSGAIVARSLVGRRATIGRRSTLIDVVVGENAKIGDNNELSRGIRVWTDAVIPNDALRFSPLP